MKRGPGKLDATLGVLNALVGDHLHREGNELSTAMGVYQDGREVPLTPEGLAAAFPSGTGQLVLFVHGLGATEAIWDAPDGSGVSYGQLLDMELGMTPLLLRYNTGRRISENGGALDALLGALVGAFPRRVEALTLVGYSMGGLVVRSACHQAQAAGSAWLPRARRAIYVGAPHLGAPLERFGQRVAWALRQVPHAAARAVAEVLDVRSGGVKDLGHGNLLEADWSHPDPAAPWRNQRAHVPLVATLAHHWVVGTLTARERDVLSWLLGDGVVPVASASGHAKARDPGARLGQEDLAVVPGVHHLALAHHPAVYGWLKTWCLGETT